MHNYFRYLPLGEDDEKWGLCVLNAGCTRIGKHQEYPYRHHPGHHYFNWKKGRTLDEYQLIYITAGEGFFESSSHANTDVREGSIMILFPGEWHRFKPKPDTGWDEYWVGFKGAIIDNLVRHGFIRRQAPILSIGFHADIILLLTGIIEQTKKEKAGYQSLISGMVLHLLGAVHSVMRQKPFQAESLVETTVNQAILLFRSNIDQQMAMEEVAASLNVGYAWFRKVFKQYTGIAPHQYFMQLKIEKAKILLNDPDKPIKEIAYELHFDYPLNFSVLFKKKVGLSPDQYRKMINKKENR